MCQNRFYDRFSKNNSKFFWKFFEFFFFKSCSFDAKTSAKNNFFFEKIPPKISAKNSSSVFCSAAVLNFRKIDFFLFLRVFHTQKNNLTYFAGDFSTVLTNWNNLTSTADLSIVVQGNFCPTEFLETSKFNSDDVSAFFVLLIELTLFVLHNHWFASENLDFSVKKLSSSWFVE